MCKRTERSKATDSLEWSKKFDILSVSRLSLTSTGIPYDLVASLTDEDMQAIAEQIADMVIQEPIEKIAEFVARLYIAEKGNRHGKSEPMQQTSDA